MRNISLLAICIFFSACTHQIAVKSSDPAIIEVGGIAVCENTPCEVQVTCRDGSRFEFETITAQPKVSGQYVQQKTVHPCNLPKNPTIFFEMKMGPRTPSQEIIVTPGKPQ